MVPTFDGNTLENESFSSGGHSDPCGAGPQILRKSCEVKIQASAAILVGDSTVSLCIPVNSTRTHLLLMRGPKGP